MRLKDPISTETPHFAGLAQETFRGASARSVSRGWRKKRFAGLAQEMRILNRNPEQPCELRANKLELNQERIVTEG